MKKILLLAAVAFSMFGYAQDIPDMKGKSLSEVCTYFDKNLKEYYKDTSISENATIIKAIVEKKYSKDGKITKAKVLKLKFNPLQECTFSKIEYVTLSNGPSLIVKPKMTPGSTLQKAGTIGIIASTLSLLGVAIFASGVQGEQGNRASVIVGGTLSLVGIILNFASWNEVRNAGVLMSKK